MVAPGDVRLDERALQTRAQRSTDHEVVQTPPDVPRAHARHPAPPGVMPAAFFELAEGVHETRAHQRAEPGAFLGREAVVLHVGLRFAAVDPGVGRVEPAAKDVRFGTFELLEEAAEGAAPPLP